MSESERVDWLTSLKQMRDELKLKVHLASMDAQEEYTRLNERLHQFEATVQPKAEDAVVALDETAHAIAEDLKAGFEMLRESVRGSKE